jgi:lipoate-protein ligase A
VTADNSTADNSTAGRPDGQTACPERCEGAGWNVQVDAVGRSGTENMRIDEALLEDVLRSGNAYLRLYCWDPPTLSIGRNQQDVFGHLPVVRRPTGGKAVWHDDEVTYAVAAPIALFGSLRNAYCEIHSRLAQALRTLGVAATLAPYGAPVRPSDGPTSCFASPVGGEILVGGRKLVGSAQVRRAGAFLQHGSILLAGKQPGGRLETTLATELGRPVSFDELATAVVTHWPSGRPAARHCFSSPGVKC